jgi:hypothetical protein
VVGSRRDDDVGAMEEQQRHLTLIRARFVQFRAQWLMIERLGEGSKFIILLLLREEGSTT